PHTYPLSPISPPVSRRDEPFSDTSGYFPDHDDHGRNPVRAEPDSLRSPGTAFGQLWGMVAVGGADFYSHRIISYPVQQLRPVSVRSPAGMAVWSNRLFIFVPVLRLCRSEEHTSELQSRENLVCRLLLEKKKIL